jgi:hypothetical protein
MIDQKEFDRRVEYNYNLFKKQIKSNTFTPSLYYLLETEPKGLTTLQYAKRIWDIYAAAVCGVLAMSSNTDKDAVLIKNNNVTKIELKTSSLETRGVFKTTKGKVFVGYRTNLSSYLSATFSGYHESDMPVYFVLTDTSSKWETELVGVWQMDGKTVNKCLLENKQSIGLSKFIKYGKRKLVKVDTIGYSKWFNTMYKRLPVKKTTHLN